MPQSKTTPQQGERQEAVPRAPHERDESSDSQQSAQASQRRIGKQALKDVESERVDTDKGPAMDDTYHRVRESAPKPAK